MFYGQFDTVVDDKWRLLLPSSLMGNINDHLIIGLSDDRCIRIYPNDSLFQQDDYPYLYKGVVRKGNRVVIPGKMRDSTSFHYGKKITVAGYGKFLELWPRP